MSTSTSTPSPSSSPKLRPIVSSFLTCSTLPPSPSPSPSPSTSPASPTHPPLRITLFHRSPLQPLFPSLWAACSGSIEPLDPNPRSAALREIREETGLREEQLELLREGEGGYEVLREGEGEEGGWRIWVFLWRIVGAEEGEEGKGKREVTEQQALEMIKLDWEHDDVRFVGWEEVERMQTVGHLGRSLRRVLGVEAEAKAVSSSSSLGLDLGLDENKNKNKNQNQNQNRKENDKTG